MHTHMHLHTYPRTCIAWRYITVHYVTFTFTIAFTLHYVSLHYITSHYTWRDNTLYYIASHDITLQYLMHYITLYITLYIALHASTPESREVYIFALKAMRPI